MFLFLYRNLPFLSVIGAMIYFILSWYYKIVEKKRSGRHKKIDN